jgi:hypothetical protein
MKIHEIISESQQRPTPLVLNESASNVKAAVMAHPKVGATMRKILQWRRMKNKASGIWAAKWSAKIGKPLMGILWLLGLTAACYDLWDNLGDAEEMYTEGEIDETQLRDFRQFYTGLFMTQMVVPAVAKALVTSRYVTWIARTLIRIIEMGTGVVTAGTSLVAMVATEAFFAWFTWWLGTQTAKDWLAQHVLEPLIFAGSIPESAWSALTGYYDKVDAKRVAKGKPSGKADPDSKDLIGSIKPKVEPVMIGGVRVTDSDGYLLPMVASGPAVQAALSNPAEAKKLAAIPKRPDSAAESDPYRSNQTMAVDPESGKLVPAR